MTDPTGKNWVATARPGGWVRLDAPYSLPTDFRGRVYLQLKPFEPLGGRLMVHNAVMAGELPITARTWRLVPIDAVEVWAATDPRRVDEVLTMPEPKRLGLIDDLDHYFAETDVEYRLVSNLLPPGGPPSDLARVVLGGLYPADQPPPKAEPLTAPKGQITQEFLVALTQAYARVVGEGKPPAKTIAEETGVPVRTVHGWISRARKAGILSPGRRGRAG